MELKELKRLIERSQLGFTDIRYRVVYCNRKCDGANWYYVEDGQQVPIHQNALRGYADRLEVVELQRRGKDTSKVQFTLNCGDMRFVLEAGESSEFAQSLVYALATLNPAQLKETIIVQPEPGEDNSVLFARVRTSDYKRVFVERNKFTGYEQALELAIANVHAASGYKPRDQQTEETQQPAAAPATNRLQAIAQQTGYTPTPAQGSVDVRSRFQAITRLTGHSPSQLRAIAKAKGLPANSEEMQPPQQVAMRDAIFLDWAAKFMDLDPVTAMQHYTAVIDKTDGSDAATWAAWSQFVQSRHPSL